MVDQVKDLDPRNQYTATSGQTVFPYTFPIFDKDDLVVIQEGTTLTEGTNYTVSGVGDEDGGNVTLTTGATVNDVITIYRDIALNRLTDYQNSGDFLATDVNDDFDRQVFMIQQLSRDINRALRFSQDDEISSTEIANKTTRSNKVLGFDTSGELSYVSATLATGDWTYFATVAAMQAATDLTVGVDVVMIGERANSLWDVIASTTNNGYDILDGTGSGVSLQLRVNGELDLKAMGAVDGSDSTAAIDAWLDYLIANPGVTGTGYSETYLCDLIDKPTAADIEINGTAIIKATGSNRLNMFRLTGCTGTIKLNGFTFDGDNKVARPVEIRNDNSTSSTLGSVYVGKNFKSINAKNNTPDTYVSSGIYVVGGFSVFEFGGEVDEVDNSLTSGGFSVGVWSGWTATAADDWIRRFSVLSTSRIKNVKNDNSTVGDADGIQATAPTSEIAFFTCAVGAYFENCKGRAIKSQVVKNSILAPVIKRDAYDGVIEIDLQYSGGKVAGAQVYHDGTRVDDVVVVTQRATPDNTQAIISGNELTVTGTPSSDTDSMVFTNVTDGSVKNQGVKIRDNSVKGQIAHFVRSRNTNATNDNHIVIDGNWAETISSEFLEASLFGSSRAHLLLSFTNNGCEDGCTGADIPEDAIILDERGNKGITALKDTIYNVTIASGAITVYGNVHRVATEGGASTDDLDTINLPTNHGRGPTEFLTLIANNNGDTVTLKDNSGNLKLAGDFDLSHTHDRILLAWDSSADEWIEMARSNNDP